jgi:hypothetical protein
MEKLSDSNTLTLKSDTKLFKNFKKLFKNKLSKEKTDLKINQFHNLNKSLTEKLKLMEQLNGYEKNNSETNYKKNFSKKYINKCKK